MKSGSVSAISSFSFSKRFLVSFSMACEVSPIFFIFSVVL